MSGGIGDFSVTAGKDGSAPGNAAVANTASRSRQAAGPIPPDAHSHYIVLSRREWEQAGPIRFHNGMLDELKAGFKLAAKVPLPEMPGFFPAGSDGDLIIEGKDVLHPGNLLRNQPLFASLESLRALVQRCAERRVAFPEFIASLNKIPIPPEWRNKIVNGLFDTAPNAPAIPDFGHPATGGSQDVDRLLGMLDAPAGTPLGTPATPGLSRFLEEVGRDSTGFTLREAAARELQKELGDSVSLLRSGLLSHASVREALGFTASLNRLARLAKGREKQNVHLWSRLPENPESLLAGDKNGEIRDIAQALVLLAVRPGDEKHLAAVSALAARLDCPLMVQLAGEDIPAEAGPLLSGPAAGYTYFFAGGVAAQTEGEAHVLRPAALAFLEGLVAAKEGAEGFRDKAMVLEDQDVITEKGQARSTDRLLDNVAAEAYRPKGVNRVNGVRNRNVAVFPPLIDGKGRR